MLGEKKVLRDDQAEAIERLRDALRAGRRRVVMQAATGYGKTLVACAIAEAARAKNKRVIFTVPALSLVEQTVSVMQREGLDGIGVMQAHHEMTNWEMPIQVASVQTLMRRNIPPANVVIVDECHRWFDFYGKWFTDPAWQAVPFIGLSATPWTKGLGAYYQELIVAGTTQQMIDKGVLSPFRVFAPSHPDLRGVRTVAGDYHEGELSTAMQKGSLTADVVKTWLDKANGMPTLCFAVDRAHADHLRQRFLEAGVKAEYMDANTKLEERERIRHKFHSGDVEVVCNVGVLTTGIDWDVRCLILARPTKSEILFVQIIGRALRTAEGKQHALILDHSDTHNRLGFVTDIHHDELNDGKTPIKDAAGNAPLPKECPACTFLMAPRIAVCPNCGHTFKRESKVVHAPGELQELGVKPAPSAKRFPDRVTTSAMLKGYALERGYQPGWAANKYKDLYGVWPRGEPHRAAPRMPSMELRSWIKSTQIRWAAGKRKAEQPRRDAMYIEGVRSMANTRPQSEEPAPPPPPAIPPAQRLIPGTLMTAQDLEDFR